MRAHACGETWLSARAWKSYGGGKGVLESLRPLFAERVREEGFASSEWPPASSSSSSTTKEDS